MKRSTRVTLTAVAAMGLAACNRQRHDPCEAASFSEQACQEATRSGGYYWQGGWFPMSYHYPYPYYYDSYRRYVSTGHTVTSPPASSYSHPATASPGVERGGFGTTGASHGAGE